MPRKQLIKRLIVGQAGTKKIQNVLSFSEALVAKLDATGVTVTALYPGPTASGFQDKAGLRDSALFKGKRLPTAEEVGIAGYHAMQCGQQVFIPGMMNWLLAQSIRFAPRPRVATSLAKHLQRPSEGRTCAVSQSHLATMSMSTTSDPPRRQLGSCPGFSVPGIPLQTGAVGCHGACHGA
jgi:hypothetical protein